MTQAEDVTVVGGAMWNQDLTPPSVCCTFGLVILGLQLQSAALLDANTTTTQQLLQGGAEGGVQRLRRLDGQQQHQHPQVLTETGRRGENGWGRRVLRQEPCVRVCVHTALSRPLVLLSSRR